MKKISALVVFILSPLSVWANEEITVPLPSREFIEMVRIEAGTFLMGTPTELVEEWRSYNEHQEEMKPTSFINIPISDEDPQHQVTISKSFYLGKYEVSRNQWFAILNPDQRKVYQGISMSGISWNEIQDYIALLNEQTGLSFRLPTEAEWEYSARAGTTTLWWTGDDTSEADRTIKNSYTSNPWGLVKILGGVMELTSDGKRKYKDQHEIDPVGPDPRMESVSRAVMRGGDDEGYAHVTGWMGSYPYYARCAYRMAEYIDRGNRFWIGFRLLLEEDSVTNVRGDESWGKIKKKATTSVPSQKYVAIFSPIHPSSRRCLHSPYTTGTTRSGAWFAGRLGGPILSTYLCDGTLAEAGSCFLSPRSGQEAVELTYRSASVMSYK